MDSSKNLIFLPQRTLRLFRREPKRIGKLYRLYIQNSLIHSVQHHFLDFAQKYQHAVISSEVEKVGSFKRKKTKIYL